MSNVTDNNNIEYISKSRISIGLLNGRSMLTRNSDINKPIAIHELVTEKKYDIFAITETWLRAKGDEASIAELTPTNYAFLHVPQPKTTQIVRGGGVGLMYRTDLFQVKKMVPLSDIKTLELFRLQISSLSDRRFGVYIVYHPPRGTKLSGTETDFYSDLDILFTEA